MKKEVFLGRVIEKGNKETTRDVLNELLDLSLAKDIKQDGRAITVQEFQEVIREEIINLCELTGNDDLWLKK